MHRLLKRQIAKFLPEEVLNDDRFAAFLKAVDDAYLAYENDYAQVERTLELSSNELFKSNQQLSAINQSLEVKVSERTTQLEQRNAELLDAQRISRMGSFEIDFVNGFSQFTDQSAELLGLSNEELKFDADLIRRLRRRVIRDDIPAIDQLWAKSMANREDVSMDFRVRDNEGNVVYLHWKVKNEFNSKGNLCRLSGTLQDVTERKLLEERARLASVIIENSPTILFRWRISESWPVEYVSGNVSQFGFNIEDFLSEKINYADIIYKDDLARVLEELSQFSELGQTSYVQRYRIVTANGAIRWVEDRTTVEKNVVGEATHHQGLITDITDTINAEQALQTSEKRFRTLVHNASDITTILGGDGSIVYESASFYRQFGYTPEEVIGKNVFQFLHPDDLEPVQAAFIEVLNGREDMPIVFRFKSADNRWIYLEAIGNNQLNEPAIQGIVVNSRDVSERVEHQTALQDYAANLEKINKELDQFAYIVSHDLKAPLRAINNLSQWIEEDLEGKLEGDTQRNFELLRGRIHRMEALINGILQYSRAGRVKSENVTIDVQSFVKDIISNLAPPAHFNVEIDPNLPVIQAEKIALDQVFSNFISNAIKYNNNPKPEIQVTGKDLGKEYQFGIVDNGPGIPPEFHEKVFMIFQTLQARDTVESTGVGLAIVKKIVEEKGGRVWIESEAGKGSAFYFTLPKEA